MSEVKFNAQSIDNFWSHKSQKSQTEPDSKLSQFLADNQLSKPEYEQLKAQFLKENPKGDFEQFLADALDGKIDNTSPQALKDILTQMSQSGSAIVSIAFHLNDQENGYSNIASVSLSGRKDQLSDKVKQADKDNNFRLEGQEKKDLLKAFDKHPELKAQLTDSLSTLTYDPNNQFISVHFVDPTPRLQDNTRDVRFQGQLDLKDLDGVNDTSRNDLQGKVDGKVDLDHRFLSEVIRDSLNPNLPDMSGKKLGLSGGFKFSLQNERYDSKRGMFVVNATTTLSAGVSRFSKSVDIPIEIQVLTSPEGELQIRIPALDDVSVPGIRAAAWSLRDSLLNRVADGVQNAVDRQDMGIQLQPSVKTIQGEYTNWHFGTDTGPVSQRLLLQPKLKLNIPSPYPGQGQNTMSLDIKASRHNTHISMDRQGIHLKLNKVPVSGSSEAQSKITASSQLDRKADSVTMDVDYGLDIDLKKGHMDHELVIKEGQLDLDLDQEEIEKMTYLPEHDKALGQNATAQMHLRGRIDATSGQTQLEGKVALDSDRTDAFTHFKSSGQDFKSTSVNLSGLKVKHDNPKQNNSVKVSSETGRVKLSKEQTDLDLFKTGAQVELNLEGLQWLQNQMNSGNDKIIKALRSVGLHDDIIQKLSQGQEKDLDDILKLENFGDQLKKALVQLNSESLSVSANAHQVEAEATLVQAHAHSETRTADGTYTHTTVSAKAESIKGSSVHSKDALWGLKQLQSELKSSPETLENKLLLAGVTPEQVEQLKNASESDMQDLARELDVDKLKRFWTSASASASHIDGALSASTYEADGSSVHVSAEGQVRELNINNINNPINLKMLKDLQGRLQAVPEGIALAQKLKESGFSDSEINALKTSSSEELKTLKDNTTLLDKLNELGAKKELQFLIQGARGSASIQSQESDESSLNIHAGAEGLDAELSTRWHQKMNAQELSVGAEYTDQSGTQIDAGTVLKDANFHKKPDGSFVLKAPNAKSEVKVKTVLNEMKKLVGVLGNERFEKLMEDRSQEELESTLENAGWTEKEIARATRFLWHPQTQRLIDSSDFIQALGAASTFEVELSSQTSVTVTGEKEGQTTTTAQGTAHIKGQLKDEQGRNSVDMLVEAGGVDFHMQDNEAHITSDMVRGDIKGSRLDGSEFARIYGQAQAVKLDLSSEKKELTTGQSEAELIANTTLEEHKLTEIINVLNEFKGAIENRLKSFGLGRKQLENLLKAMGHEQLKKLFERADAAEIERISKEYGISSEQMERMGNLLSDQQFLNLLNDISSLSNVLRDAQLTTHAEFSVSGSQWTESDEKMTATLKDLAGSIQFDAQNEEGNAQLNLKGQQEMFKFGVSKEESSAEWSTLNATLDGHASNTLETQMDFEGTFESAPGSIVKDKASQITQTELGKMTGQFTGQLKGDKVAESSGSWNASVGHIQSTHHGSSPKDSTLEVTDVQSDISLHNTKDGHDTQLKASLGIEQIRTLPDEVELSNMKLGLNMEADVNRTGQQDHGTFELKSSTDTVHLQEDEFTMDKTQLDADFKGQVGNGKDQPVTFNASLSQAEIDRIKAKGGHIQINKYQANTELSGQTSVGQTQLSGRMSFQDLELQNNEIKANGFALDQLNGEAKIKTDKLRQIFADSPNAKRLLEMLSHHDSSLDPDKRLFENDTITLKLKDAAFQSMDQEGQALSGRKLVTGRLELPDLEMALGSSQVSLDLKNIMLHPDGSEKPPEIEVSGHATFSPKEEAFTQKVNEFVKQWAKDNNLPDLNLSVKMDNGKFKVKIDRWWAEGMLDVDFEQDKMSLKINQAEFLRFISVRGLVSKKVANELEKNLLEYNRPSANQLDISLNDLTEQVLHRDNLNITSVTFDENNQFNIDFKYTDTQAYNAQAQTRKSQRLESRLFKDPKSGQSRDTDSLEDIVEDLSVGATQKVFKDANTQQLDRLFKAVGNDYDNIIREKVLKNPSKINDYSPASRALMAAKLSDDSGFLEGVSDQERRLLFTTLNSLNDAQTEPFIQQLKTHELTRIFDEMADLYDNKTQFKNTLSQFYQQLKTQNSRDMFQRALMKMDSEVALNGVLGQLQEQQSGPQLHTTLYAQNEDRMEDIIENMTSTQLHHMFEKSSLTDLKKGLEAVGNDYDNIVRKGMQGLQLDRVPLANRALMAHYLSQNSGFLESVNSEDKAALNTLLKSLNGSRDFRTFVSHLSRSDQAKLQKYANREWQAAFERSQKNP